MERRAYVVVIRDGDERGKVEVILNLAAFDIERHGRRERRSPVAGVVVQLIAVDVAAVAFAVCEDWPKYVVALAQNGEVTERLVGHGCVAVERDAGGEALCRVAFTPGIRDAGLLHSRPSVSSLSRVKPGLRRGAELGT